MSPFFAAFSFLVILSLGETGNIYSPEYDDMDLLGRSWDPEDPVENIGITKRASIRNFNMVKLREFKRLLEKARKQQYLLSQQEVEPIGKGGWNILEKVFPTNEILNMQTLEAPEDVRNSLSRRRASGGLSYGRG